MSRHGKATTPPLLYRAAIKRNLSIARQLRNQPQVLTRHYPSTMANRERLLRERTIMLSVDLGLLFVASKVFQLPETSKSRPKELPDRDDWRDNASQYFDAVECVRSIYLAHGKGILARDGTERWIRKLHDHVLNIF